MSLKNCDDRRGSILRFYLRDTIKNQRLASKVRFDDKHPPSSASISSSILGDNVLSHPLSIGRQSGKDRFFFYTF